MSDMKLYRGINNIDDDLIEEAGNQQHKPVIRRYYSFAASAAVLLLAAGASGWGLFRGGTDLKAPPPIENSVVTETTAAPTTGQPAASAIPGTTAPAQAAPAASATGTQPVPAVTSAVTQYAPSPQTTVNTAVSVSFTATTAPSAGNTGTIPRYDYENEGRIVMKKFFAMSTALLTLTNLPTLSAAAEPYKPANALLDEAQNVKAFIEEYNIDLDLDSDGKTDIIDMYAFYIAQCKHVSEEGAKALPDEVMEKYRAISVETEEGLRSIGTFDLGAYYFTYNDFDVSCLDPTFYTANCPEGFDTSEDTVSSFIDTFVRYGLYETGSSYKLVGDMIEKEELDMDINSDGRFDFDDILLLLSFRANVFTDYYAKDPAAEPDPTYHNYKQYSDIYDIAYSDPDIDFGLFHKPYKITESEFNKACAYFEAATKYLDTYYHEGTQLEYLIKYYLTNNVIEKKYFDPDYYTYDDSFKYHCTDYEYRSINQTAFRVNSYNDPFFGRYTYYLDFASKFGPGVKDGYSPTEEDEKRYQFGQKDVEETFPTYYKNVKTGVIPAPDLDMNGIITVADYSILYNLSCESISPFDDSDTAELIRNYPELRVKIKVPEDIRENYNTNFDFNENGISSDKLETECMMMYILNELDNLYDTEEAFTEACEYYMHSHPGIDYEALLTKELNKFNAERNSYDFDFFITPTGDTAIGGSVNTAAKYMSGIDLSVLRTGDANCDSSTSLADALLVLQNTANSQKYPITAEGEFNADVFATGDGLTAMDAFVIQQRDTQRTV